MAVIVSNKVVPRMKNAMAIANELNAVSVAAIKFQTSLLPKRGPWIQVKIVYCTFFNIEFNDLGGGIKSPGLRTKQPLR